MKMLMNEFCRCVKVRVVRPDWPIFESFWATNLHYKSNPNVWRLFWLLRKHQFSNKNCRGYFMIFSFQLLVTLERGYAVKLKLQKMRPLFQADRGLQGKVSSLFSNQAKAIPAISNFVNLFYFWSFTFCIAHATAGRGGGDDLIKSHFERKKNPIQTSCHCEKRVVASIPGNEYAYPEGIFFFNNFILHFRDFTQLS